MRVSRPIRAYACVNVWVHYGSIVGPLWVYFGSIILMHLLVSISFQTRISIYLDKISL